MNQSIIVSVNSFVFVIFHTFTLSQWAVAEEAAHGGHQSHHHHQSDREMRTTDEIPEMSLFQLQSKWRDQEGRQRELKDFVSKPTIFAMTYTTCDYACPVITSTMLKLEKKAEADKINDVQFLLISLDPLKDTPKQLKKYATKRGLNLKKWTLLTAEESSVRELAVVLGVNYKRLQGGDIAHSNVIFLMDQNGLVKDKVIGLNKDASRLIEEVKKLKRSAK